MNIKSLYIFVNERLGNTIINLDFWSEQISFKKDHIGPSELRSQVACY